MTNLVFSAAERKQINLRFDTLYKILTEDTWTTGYMGIGGTSTSGSDELDQDDLRKMGKSGKKKPVGLQMCLVGAAAYVNGPTEEEILALLATAVTLDRERYDEEINEYIRENYPCFPESEAFKALVVFDLFANGQEDLIGADRAGDEVIEFNDNRARDVGDVHAMIKKAQDLYDTVYAAWEVEKAVTVHLNKIETAFADLDKPKKTQKKRRR